MKKKVFGRKLKRDKNERKALFKSLMSALVLHEDIETTEQKAKSVKGSVEKLVTKVKKHGQQAERFLHEYLTPPAITKLITDVTPRFAQRNGGYTRMIRLGKRFNDDASMVILEWVEKGKALKGSEDVPAGKQVSKVARASQTEKKSTKSIIKKESKEKPAKKVAKTTKK